jgi:hypothetical protein
VTSTSLLVFELNDLELPFGSPHNGIKSSSGLAGYLSTDVFGGSFKLLILKYEQIFTSAE